MNYRLHGYDLKSWWNYKTNIWKIKILITWWKIEKLIEYETAKTKNDVQTYHFEQGIIDPKLNILKPQFGFIRTFRTRLS